MPAYIKDISYTIPSFVVTNDDLVKEFPTWNVDKITEKIGISERHVVTQDETALDLAIEAALNSFTKFCAVEFASRKIRCNSVCPGMINTPMTKPGDFVTEDDYKKDVKSYLVGRYGEPEEIARTILFLLSDASSFITGASIIADGGSSIPH